MKLGFVSEDDGYNDRAVVWKTDHGTIVSERLRKVLEGPAYLVFHRWNVDLIVRHLIDGKHDVDSWHYVGEAADLRIRHIPARFLAGLHADLVEALPEWEVLLESDHIHIEPRGKRG